MLTPQNAPQLIARRHCDAYTARVAHFNALPKSEREILQAQTGERDLLLQQWKKLQSTYGMVSSASQSLRTTGGATGGAGSGDVHTATLSSSSSSYEVTKVSSSTTATEHYTKL